MGWRHFPERYQGFGLPNFEVYALSKRIHFLQRKWDGNDSTSKMAGTTYKAFMVEVGMYGNILSRSIEKFNVLSTKHMWYYNLWELCHRLTNNQRHNRENRDNTLESINVMRKYLNFMNLSNLVHCDGRTLSDDLLKLASRMATKVRFPKEKPTRNNKSLLGQFLNTLTDGCNTLLDQLK